MSSALTIQPRVPVHGSSETVGAVKAAAPARAEIALGPTAKPAKLFVNPDFHFDPTAGLVVIEFRNDSGNVTDTIPTQRQLEAYRTHQGPPRASDGKTPPG